MKADHISAGPEHNGIYEPGSLDDVDFALDALRMIDAALEERDAVEGVLLSAVRGSLYDAINRLERVLRRAAEESSALRRTAREARS